MHDDDGDYHVLEFIADALGAVSILLLIVAGCFLAGGLGGIAGVGL